ncbi:PIN domain-containing protein [Spirosoma panaciterrae]|uniref:PIN domain-containing protein n=1 Tax=Spirosoma panaciterrae TaxID=496058 RepID=UPI0003638EDB|nr:PIN domain-containing protein [Spirosoma panaciterrae]
MIVSPSEVIPAVVIDTNVLIATINRRNAEFFIYEAFAAKKLAWIVSTELRDEYAENLLIFIRLAQPIMCSIY